MYPAPSFLLPLSLSLSLSLSRFLALSHTEAAGDSFVLLINDENHILHNTSELKEIGDGEKEHPGLFIPIKFHSRSNSSWALFLLSAIQKPKALVIHFLLPDHLWQREDFNWQLSRCMLIFQAFRIQPCSFLFQVVIVTSSCSAPCSLSLHGSRSSCSPRVCFGVLPV